MVSCGATRKRARNTFPKMTAKKKLGDLTLTKPFWLPCGSEIFLVKHGAQR